MKEGRRMSDKLKIGLISFAHGHANSYFRCLERMPDVEITAIADERRSRVEHVLARCSAVYYEDYKELLQTDIDAVIICSENVRPPCQAYAGRMQASMCCAKSRSA
jgi:predicted dehydrogenase